ncbi:hypothetical protein JHK86_051998 [Glycine max]|nr:hypothetical protein JHK86_051998 [Glycine max]
MASASISDASLSTKKKRLRVQIHIEGIGHQQGCFENGCCTNTTISDACCIRLYGCA